MEASSSVLLTSKNDIIRPLKALANFDSKGSPYIGIQLADTFQFHRSSASGFIHTKGYFPGRPTTYVSLSHLFDCLKSMPDEGIELGLESNGILRIHGTANGLESESHVHTVLEGQAGVKRHDVGDRVAAIEPDVFSKIDTRLFRCATPPVLAKGKLMLATDGAATIIWDGPEAISKAPELYPRESFLRFVSGGVPVEELIVTANGYWGAIADDMVIFVGGHASGRPIFDSYLVSGQELAKLPAQGLLLGLQAALGLLLPTGRVDVDPRLGVVAKTKFGDNRTSIGETGEWPKFGMLAKTARVICDALSQIDDNDAVLYSVPSPGPGTSVLRLKRGPFEINFRSY